MRILIIDDDFAALRAARRALSGAETYVATDTETAVTLARRHRPDAILVDVQLGEENGLDAIPLLTEASPASAILVTSGNPGFKPDAWSSGANAWVPKSDWPMLAGIVARVLELLRGEWHHLRHP